MTMLLVEIVSETVEIWAFIKPSGPVGGGGGGIYLDLRAERTASGPAVGYSKGHGGKMPSKVRTKTRR